MPPDALLSPIAALTDHPVLSAEEEAALIEILLAGAHARAMLPSAPPSALAATQEQVALGEAAHATLARHNLRLAVSIAKRYLRVAGQHLTLDDLVSFGCFGLLRAIDRFDPHKSGKLSTYATFWIRQAIGRGIAEEGRIIDLPVHVHERLSQQRRVQGRLAQQLGREPAPDEIAATLGWRPQQLAQLETVRQEALSLNAKIRDTDERSELGDLVPDTRFDPEAAALEHTLRRDLSGAMARLLTEREQRFLRAHVGFDSGQPATLEAIGRVESLSRERVRQVIAGALAKIRADPAVAGYQEVPTDG